MDPRELGRSASKGPGRPGISPSEFGALKSRVDGLTSKVNSLAESVGERNEWSQLVRQWIGRDVRANLQDGCRVDGRLLWVDRYTFCIEGIYTDLNDNPNPLTAQPKHPKKLIVNKASVSVLHEL